MVAKLTSAAIFVLLVSTLNSSADNKCLGPVTGGIKNGDYDFTYKSWRKFQKKEGNWKFERCLRNDHGRPLWFEWESTGLQGVAESMDASFVYFDEPREDQAEKDTKLWYGPRPDNIKPKTILRPTEASWNPADRPIVWLAQDGGDGLTLEKALAERSTFADFLEQSGPDRALIIASGGRVAVAVRPDAIADLKEGKATNDDFIPVDFRISESFTLNADRQPFGMLKMEIKVDPIEFQKVLKAGFRIPTITVKTQGDLTLSSILPEGGTIELSEPVLVRQEKPAPIVFPATLAEENFVVDFGDGSARLTFPFAAISRN